MSAASDRAALVEEIKGKAVVHGRVTLASGKEADSYVDMRRITLDGVAAPLVGRVMRELTRDLAYDAVGGLTLGADPVATAMLHAAAAAGEVLDAFVVRKEGKAHGLQRRIEGAPVAEVVAVAVVVDRDTGAAERVRAEGLPYLYAVGKDELPL
jgi:orotate phosphoribosyltransferase